MSTMSKESDVEMKKRKHDSISPSPGVSNEQRLRHGFSHEFHSSMTVDCNETRAVTPPTLLANSLSQQAFQNRSLSPAPVAATAVVPVSSSTKRQEEQNSRPGAYVSPDVSPHPTPKRTKGNAVCSTSIGCSNGRKSNQGHYLKDGIPKPLAPPPKMFNFKNFQRNEDSLNTLSLLSKKNNFNSHRQNHIQQTAPASNLTNNSVMNNGTLEEKTRGFSNNDNRHNLLLGLKLQETERLRALKAQAFNHKNLLRQTQATALPYPLVQQALLCQAIGQNNYQDLSLLLRKVTSSSQISSLPSTATCTPTSTFALQTNQEDTGKQSIKKRKICKMEGCCTPADKRTPYCVKHRGQRKCEFKDCVKFAQSKTRFCIKHGGGRRCKYPNCNKGARDKVFCGAHGGGKRCKNINCSKLAVGGDDHCTAHGGGKRCQEKDCTKSAQSSSNFCVRHGGGKKCKIISCQKVARGKLGVCMAHSTAEKEKQAIIIKK